MKKRVFYVVNLDRSRILVLGVLITGFLLISFATGYRFGNTGSGIENRDLGAMQAQEEALMDPSRQGLDRSLPADEPSLQAPAPSPERRERSAPEPGPSAPARDREPKQENRTRRPASVREEKKERTSQSSRQPAKREEKEVRRPARTEPKQAARRDQRAKAEPEKRRDPPKQTQAVKLEPEKSMRMSNAAGDRAPEEPQASPARAMRSLQLGSFASRTAADRMDAQLKKQGFESAVVSVRGKFAVRVGRSASEADIARIERQLKQKNYNPVRINLP